MLDKFKWKNIKVSNKYWISIAVVIFLVASSTIIVSILLSSIKSDINVQGQRGDRAIKITEIGSLVRANHIRIINYIYDGDPQMIEEYQEREGKVDKIVSELDGRMYTEDQISLFDQVIVFK